MLVSNEELPLVKYNFQIKAYHELNKLFFVWTLLVSWNLVDLLIYCLDSKHTYDNCFLTDTSSTFQGILFIMIMWALEC